MMITREQLMKEIDKAVETELGHMNEAIEDFNERTGFPISLELMKEAMVEANESVKQAGRALQTNFNDLFNVRGVEEVDFITAICAECAACKSYIEEVAVKGDIDDTIQSLALVSIIEKILQRLVENNMDIDREKLEVLAEVLEENSLHLLQQAAELKEKRVKMLLSNSLDLGAENLKDLEAKIDKVMDLAKRRSSKLKTKVDATGSRYKN